jgi:hypothetical protein
MPTGAVILRFRGTKQVTATVPPCEKSVISDREAVYYPAIRQASEPGLEAHCMSQLAEQQGKQSSTQPKFQPEPEPQTPEEKADEARRIRRLQLMINMVMQVIQQDRSMPVEQASAMVAEARRAALAMFPDKTLAFDLIFWPRLQRLMRERYRMQ